MSLSPPMSVFETCRVGHQLPTLERDVDLAVLVRYAGASGDFNPIHFDETYARAAGLDGIIGQGMLGLALVSQLVTDWIGDSRCVRELSVRFTGSFRLGDRLIVTGEVIGRTQGDDGQVRLDLQLRCTTGDGREIIGHATAAVVSP